MTENDCHLFIPGILIVRNLRQKVAGTLLTLQSRQGRHRYKLEFGIERVKGGFNTRDGLRIG